MDDLSFISDIFSGMLEEEEEEELQTFLSREDDRPWIYLSYDYEKREDLRDLPTLPRQEIPTWIPAKHEIHLEESIEYYDFEARIEQIRNDPTIYRKEGIIEDTIFSDYVPSSGLSDLLDGDDGPTIFDHQEEFVSTVEILIELQRQDKFLGAVRQNKPILKGLKEIMDNISNGHELTPEHFDILTTVIGEEETQILQKALIKLDSPVPSTSSNQVIFNFDGPEWEEVHQTAISDRDTILTDLRELRNKGDDIIFFALPEDEFEVEERVENIRKITQQTAAVKKLFEILAELVNDQQILLDDAQIHIQNANAAARRGYRYIVRADRGQRKVATTEDDIEDIQDEVESFFQWLYRLLLSLISYFSSHK